MLQTTPSSDDEQVDTSDDNDVLVLDLGFEEDDDGDVDGEVLEEEIFDIQRGWDLEALSDEVCEV